MDVITAPLPRHQVVLHLVAATLGDYGAWSGAFSVPAPIDIVVPGRGILQPDIAAFSPARRHLIDLDASIAVVPDLCVEILSAATKPADTGAKKQAYARCGVPEYWIVDPAAETIDVLRLDGTDYRLVLTASGDDEVASTILPNLAFPASEVFPSR